MNGGASTIRSSRSPAEFARQGFLALALDLYQGKVATTEESVGAYMRAVDLVFSEGAAAIKRRREVKRRGGEQRGRKKQ
jgi:hypothetical protein